MKKRIRIIDGEGKPLQLEKGQVLVVVDVQQSGDTVDFTLMKKSGT